MSSTFTESVSYTFTEARAREVMAHVLADFMAVATHGFVSRASIITWHEEIEYCVLKETIASFELQFVRPDAKRAGLRYVVHDDGSISGGVRAGGLDLYALPKDTKAKVCISYRDGAPRLAEVQKYLASRGWTNTGSLIGGTSERDRAYASDGYAIARQKVGDWS